MQDFLENDQKVCRFYAVVDDLITSQYERRPFIIFFYLANGTMQIREQYPLTYKTSQTHWSDDLG